MISLEAHSSRSEKILFLSLQSISNNLYGGATSIRSNFICLFFKNPNILNTFILKTTDIFKYPASWRFFLITRIAFALLSTNKHLFAPRLRASIPNDPVPANKSRTILSSIESPKILNKDSFALSNIGLVRLLFNADSCIPFALPEIIRINYVKLLAPVFITSCVALAKFSGQLPASIHQPSKTEHVIRSEEHT